MAEVKADSEGVGGLGLLEDCWREAAINKRGAAFLLSEEGIAMMQDIGGNMEGNVKGRWSLSCRCLNQVAEEVRSYVAK
eukprot:8364665-Ditylum_brightwellii.AAC.1